MAAEQEHEEAQGQHSCEDPRTDGRSPKTIICDVNKTLRGWFGYFQHSHSNVFGPLDGWIRMRLRSILRKRRKRKDRGSDFDHMRWPNAYFTRHGLYSLKEARTEARRCL